MAAVKITDLYQWQAKHLSDEQHRASARGWDAPILAPHGRLLATIGTLHLYTFDVPAEAPFREDTPVTVLSAAALSGTEGEEPAEGLVVGRSGAQVFVQMLDTLGQTPESMTLVPDASGFLQTAAQRLTDMATKSDKYTLGPAERLIPWIAPDAARADLVAHGAVTTAAFVTLWEADPAVRRTKAMAAIIEAVRANKRLLVVCPDHRQADELTGALARTMKASGMTYKSLLCRYELSVLGESAGMPLQDLGFEAQMHHFYARSRADKAALRRKYERFRELTPLLAYKAQKQRDLDEVKLLEWRLLTQLSDLQRKIKDIDQTLGAYESLPIWKRLAMQTVGKNTASLGEYKHVYAQQIQALFGELETAKRRIAELAPEAAIPKDLRPEYTELKQEIKRLGGTKKIRELLAAEEDTNRQAFLQNKRVVITSAARVATDPLFNRVRFDLLIALEAPLIPAAHLLAAAGLVRERLVLSGDPREVVDAPAWAATSPSMAATA